MRKTVNLRKKGIKLTSIKELLLSEIVFDPRLGGVRGQGARYRDPKTGRLVPNPNKGESWYCQKSPTGAHYWIISNHTGNCRYCPATKEFNLFYKPPQKEHTVDDSKNN